MSRMIWIAPKGPHPYCRKHHRKMEWYWFADPYCLSCTVDEIMAKAKAQVEAERHP